MNCLPSVVRAVPPFAGLRKAACALGLLVFVGGNAVTAATVPIYKCLDRDLGVVYTDVPCKDGERMDVRAGDADPAAVARLDRERDALDRSSAQRIADERRARLQRQYFATAEFAPVYNAGADVAEYYPYGNGVIAYVPVERNRPPEVRSDRRNARQSVVPNRMRAPPR